MRARMSQVLAATCALAGALTVGAGSCAYGKVANWAAAGNESQIPVMAPQEAKQSLDAKSQFEQGQKALQKGDLDGAETAFRKVIAADPRAAGAYSNLGVIAMRRKQWDQALKLLKTAEKLEPHLAGIRLNIGLVEYRQGNYTAATGPL